MLPNLVVIGAAKCGTTSLHAYLDAHPEVSMSREKELHFFVERKNWERGLAWYESQFDPTAPVRGESSPGYSAFPLYRGVVERMAETIPHAKLVYLVRDPVDRIVSHYTHRTVNWPEMGTLEQALADTHVREWLVTPSRYWLQLERYLTRFPAEQILVVDSDELRASRVEVLARILAFIGVESSFRSPDFERAYNAGTGLRRRNGAGDAVSRVLERALGPGRSQALRERVPSALKTPFRREVEPAVVPEGIRVELEDELREDAEQLRAHTGLAFASWSI
jgi:sulfotransferase family protein